MVAKETNHSGATDSGSPAAPTPGWAGTYSSKGEAGHDSALGSLYQGRVGIPGAALGEGSLDLAPLGEAGTWSKGAWAPADGHQWPDSLVRRPTPLNPLDSAWGWRVMFQNIWLAGASAPASGGPAATPWGHHAARCCPVGGWTASGSLEAPTGHRTDCSTPTAALAHVLTLKPTLLMAFRGRGTALPRVPVGGERRLSRAPERSLQLFHPFGGKTVLRLLRVGQD